MKVTRTASTPGVIYRERQCKDDNCRWIVVTKEVVEDDMAIVNRLLKQRKKK